MKFALNNKDVNSIKADLPDGSRLEFYRLTHDEWALLGHFDNHVSEFITFKTEDWEIIWKMLTEK